MNDVIECQHILAIKKSDLHRELKRQDRSRLFHIYHLSCQRQLTTKWKLLWLKEASATVCRLWKQSISEEMHMSNDNDFNFV